MSTVLQPQLYTIEETAQAIEEGKILSLAGEEKLLAQLPKGRWIGATSPYFMTPSGGVSSKEKIFVHELDPATVERVQLKLYSTETIHTIAQDAPENGWSLLLLPALTDIQLQYAENGPDYDQMFLKPIIGWVAGIHLDDLGKNTPKVFNGGTGECCEDKAVVMHVTLPPDQVATIGIINIQQQGDGDILSFPNTGFTCDTVLVNGVEENFADYLTRNQIDIKRPLVADYSGASINVSFHGINTSNKTVSFYAPVFTGIEYKLASPVENYVEAFTNGLPQLTSTVSFSCNCILNYLYSELEGKKVPPLYGPITFGEIAYQLLNQTMVYLVLDQA